MKKLILVALPLIVVVATSAYFWSDIQRAWRFAGLSIESHQVVPELGIVDGKLSPCPNKRNCWNSDDPQEKFLTAPLIDSDGSVWASIESQVMSLPRTKLVEKTDSYLRITQQSKWFRFVDDIEFQHRPEEGIVAIRSGSRVGFGDFGVNAERIEIIRQLVD